ncbi:hypothetical protein M436DRAFT_80283 [Aureobasidium namibiae CBS 147.97]|uniref:BTB domain-containing protein n=1 Tax=Aureobasidium namibiae CBS 147.97 TaxID=1043004 RepID=A0A074XJU9_9PEZI
MEAIASKSQWNIYALDRILTSPLSLAANNMIELRTTCGWKVLVHKTLLCHYSKYYEVAIYGGFQEAKNDYFDLGLNKPCAEWFVRWLYSGKLSGPDTSTDIGELFRLYIFADEKDILALTRDVMTRLPEFDPYLSYQEIVLPIKSLPSSSPLYKFIVAWHATHWMPDDEDSERENQAMPLVG